MTYKYRYILTFALLLMVGKAVAQVTVKGSVFGGGNKADVQVNTIVNIGGGQVEGNVYGGGNLGDVGKINDKSDKANYTWTGTDNQPNSSGGANNTGVSSVHITGSTALIGLSGDNVTANKDHGNVFGGGKGDDNSGFYCEKGMVYSTSVEITAGTVKGTVFGGGEVGRVEDNTIVTIGVPGASREGEEDPSTPVINGDVFGAGKGLKTHGYSALVRGNPVVTVQGKTLVGGSVYGGGEIASVGKHKVKTSNSPLTPDDAPADLPVGMPYTLANTNLGKCTVTIKDNVIISNNVFGAGQGFGDYSYDSNNKPQRMGMADMETLESENLYHVFLQTLALATDTHVTIDGNANVNGSVFGGSESGFVQYDTNVTIKGGTVGVDVYGGGRGLTNNTIAGRVSGNSTVTINGGITYGSVYGGGAYGVIKESVTVNVTGGEVKNDVYGGGALANTNTDNWDATANSGAGGWAAGKTSASHTTHVNVLGGVIGTTDNDGKPVNGRVFGGGLGDKTNNIEAFVYGDVKVNLNGLEAGDYVEAAHGSYVQAVAGSGTNTTDHYELKTTTTGEAPNTTTTYATGAIVNSIFAANNQNGTPKGNTTVHVYATQNRDAEHNKINQKYPIPPANNATVSVYDVTAVYGGGNLANYVPVYNHTTGVTEFKTQVIIEGCSLTSIETVYGGGNAAAVPETNVTVKSAYEIGYVFGGGDGHGGSNPGADVGVFDKTAYEADKTTGTYGTGNANTLLEGGMIHEVYGGSNQKGIIRGSINQTTDPKDSEDPDFCCELVMDKVVGAGKYADIDGDVNMTLSCQPSAKVPLLFAGADEANVNGNITLNITNGNFGQVFGGNNLGGAVKGKITVNVEETGCQPIRIDELYLGGNEAAYSVFGYYESNETHSVTGKKILKPRTSTTDENLPVKHDGTNYASISAFTNYDQPVLNIISCTYIGSVFGGGLGAPAVMYANPTVNINQTFGKAYRIVNNHQVYDAVATTLGEIGDVYGGGNAAEVVGNTTVNIGNLEYVEMTTFPRTDVRGYYTRSGSEGNYTYTEVTGDATVAATPNTSYYKKVEGANITGNVYGGGKGKDDNVETALVRGNATVNMAGGTVKGNIYGGGELSSVGDFTYDTNKMVTACTTTTGTTTVNISGGTIGDESEYTYDANNTITQTNGGNVFAGGKGSLRKADNSGYLPGWYKFAKVKNTVLNISGTTTRIMSNAYGGGELATVGYETSGTTHSLVGGTSVTISGGTIGTEIQSGSGTSATTEYTFGSLYGGGFGSDVETTISGQTDNTDPYAPKFYAGRVYGSTSISMSAGAVKASVYGGGQLASVGSETATGGNATVTITGGSVGINKVGDKQFGGATMGNVYGGGSGKKTIVRAGQIFGNTTVSISGTPTIYHNVYGGGAYGSVGTYEYDTEVTSGFSNVETVTGINSCTDGGTATVTITSGTIGVDGKENGMVFGSSRGDVGAPGSRDDLVAWVNNTIVTIGDANTGPQINGSVYGSGENGHTLNNAAVTVHSGTIGIASGDDVTVGTTTYKAYNYPDRGNVYGGGCGTDKYYSNLDEETYDGNGDTYNPLAGIVQGTTSVTIDGGRVVHNVYGAGAMGSVGKTNANNAITSGGTTTIVISGGIVGVDNADSDGGNIFGAARGDATSTQEGIAQVKTTSVTISGATTGTIIKGNVYGGGQMGNVQATTTVDIQGGAIKKNVYGGGMGDASTFTCAKAMVGIADEGAGADPGTDTNKNKGTSVTISNGTVGTLNSGNLVDGTGNVYGGGQIARVEWNTQVTIGLATGSGTPYIYGNVFGAGKGLETHGYSALVRGNSTVIVQGNAQVGKNVYGGGEKATVGRYWVKDINNKDGNGDVLEAALPVPDNLPSGMPYKQQSGGICRVTIQGSAEIGYNGADDDAGHVFGAGQGVEPSFVAGTTERMVNNNTGGSLIAFTDDTTTGKTAEQLYLEFLETLALVTNSYVTIDGSAKVKGSVFGGSESGFVQHDTNVTVNNGTIGTNGTTASYGNVFGGGRGLEAFAEAGKVKGNTTVNVSNGIMYGNVYGGGNLGDVGTIDKTDINNYTWSGYDDTDPSNDTGICTVSVAGGTVQKNVFGAGKGSGVTFQCEKAMAYNTKVSVSGGTVNGNVYGGGEIGRVENDTQVTIGRKTEETEGNGTGTPDIKGSVFGAGKGLATHGYSALVRGNTAVTVEGASGAKVGVDVYGGGEIASVGRYGLNPQKMPNILLDGGRCIVKVLGNVVIGPANASDDKGNVFGAGKGVSDPLDTDNEDKSQRSRRMTVYTNSTDFPEDAKLPATGTPTGLTPNGTTWEYYASGSPFVWEYFQDNAKYNTYLETLALATHPEVTIAGGSTINSSVFGGGELGLTKGSVIVNINGGTIVKDVYGGGSLANTNTTDKVGVKDNVNGGWKKKANGEYETTDVAPTTTVNLQGGIMRHAYGGGLGRVGANPIEAKVYGDVTVKLNEGKSTDDTGAKVDRVFGANNLNGSPQGNVTVRVYATQNKDKAKIGNKNDKHDPFDLEADGATTTTYDVIAVYGGGNEAAYIPGTAYTAETPTGSKTQVFIEGCDATSIKTVYGGGNAASVPESNVTILSAYEIERVFGGGNGKDDTSYGTNPGADIGVYKNASNEDVIYGTGNANTDAQGGYIHELYGASNEKGTIKGNISLKTEQKGNCTLKFDRIYNAGKNADVEGDMIAVLGCQPDEKIPEYYGGAENANVKGNVELTITSGTFGQIFAGNNKGGAIFGHIKLNIEETGCRPIIIDELYGCGNNAAYSVYGYYHASEDNNNQAYSDEAHTTPLYKKLNETDNLYYLYWDDKYERPFFRPRTSADDSHAAVFFGDGSADDHTKAPYAHPEVNIISCTSIGKVFGGGLGSGAVVYGNPTVNINQIYGTPNGTAATTLGEIGGGYTDGNNQYVEGGVFGGGNAADVIGNTTVNIGTVEKIRLHESWTAADGYTMSDDEKTVLGANIVGDVYGGGNEADVTGNTFVNICAKEETNGSYTSVAFGESASGVTIGGDVFGGGKGKADTFTCEKAMIGTNDAGLNADYADGNTNVVIGNGTINGTVYGGGQIGRVERNTTVTIGIGDGTATGPLTSAPEIKGNVFGAGAGEEEHGYAALVRGNPTVTIQGNAKIGKSVYGGGEIASVARYRVAQDATEAAEHGVEVGMPYVLQNNAYGHCVVTIGGYAEIGPDNMKMYHSEKTDGTDKPDDYGHVFGAGRGVLPKVYTSYGEAENGPRRMVLAADKTTSIWEYFVDEEKYFEFIRTLALATETQVTIGDHAFVKGSVYGGSENGIVQYDTNVTIKDHCQIGQGKEITMRYEDYTGGDLFELTTPPVKSGSGSETVYYDLECASWDYGLDTNADGKKDLFAPYDPNANATGDLDKYPAVGTATAKSTEGGRRIATDGHTYYGNVFGGGSGSVPYFDTTKGVSRYIMSAGWVKGNTNVTISGGHILTNVYGGNEATNVDGTATITMTGGTIGVPRTLQQIVDHPLTCYLFGAGKGDQRAFFNKDTNVKDVVLNLTGGRIYGSVFGGGEDGHVLRDVTMTIGQQTTTGEGNEAVTTTSGPTIGTWGTSYVDGNVFGGGRGFGGDAYTAGNVAGSVTMQILGGTMLGSIYGGGRLGSVGYGLFDATESGYGEMRADDAWEEGFSSAGYFTHGRGHIDITISGGTIGNDHEYKVPNASNIPNTITEQDISKWTTTTGGDWDKWKAHNHIPKTEFDTATGRLTHTKGGNVFAGGMGRFYQLDGTTPISVIDWWKLGNVKSTKLTITGGTIKSNVYGGGELGQVVEHHTTQNANFGTEITIQGSSTQIGTEVKNGETTEYTFGSVFGGGYGSLLDDLTVNGETTHPKFDAGLVKEDTKIDMQGGVVKASIYGGGEMASVGEKTSGETTTVTGSTYVTVSSGTVGIAPITVSGTTRYFGGAKMGNVYGGGSGHNNTVRSGRILKNTNVTISDGTIYHNVYGGGAYGTVGDFEYQTGSDYEGGPVKVQGINGLATTGTGVANVTIIGGTIGYDGNENGMVFGSSRGDINEPGKRDDHCAWVYDTNVIIGTEGSETGPQIKGTVYGSGENGHTYNNTVVTVNSGTIGIAEGSPIGTYTEGGAAYPYRGNVYGGGCGTDTYPVTVTEGEGQSAVTIQAFNPLAGIVYGNTTVNINGGKVVRNVYGAGAMGSVGKTTWTTTSTTTGDVTTTTKSATTSGGSTTININGGIIGVSGTVGDGNLFGAARGSKAVVQADRDDLSRVSVTNVNVSGGLVKGNVYGGGELGDVGTIVKNTTDYNYTWEKSDGGSNVAENNKITGTNTNTGICNVTITGGTIGSTTAGTGNVFGGGKGDANTWWCEKAMAFATNVSISGSDTKVYGTVYGGGEIGRVEDDTKVIIGTENGSDIPDIKGNVFGAGKGMATRGYSALVRGNSIVTIQGNAKVGGNVFGGGEEASLGRFVLDKGLPKSPASGGSSEVTIQDNAKIGSSGTGNHVYGAGQGVNPAFDSSNYKNFKSMQLDVNKGTGAQGTDWDYYVDDDGNKDRRFVWVYYKTEPEYQAFLNTLALASHPTVTIAENATIYGDVYGGGQRGITLGNVAVNITGGTVKKDVYGGGSLADTNKGNWDDSQYVPVTLSVGHTLTDLYTKTGDTYIAVASDATATSGTTYYSKGTWATGKYDGKATTYKTNVALTGGTIEGNVYGGGLGQIARAASAAQGTEGQEGYVPAVTKLDEVKAKVYGDVLVTLNKPTTSGETTTYGNCVVKENIFGCNNQNGSPQSAVTVHVYKTEGWTGHEGTSSDKLDSEEASDHSYHLNGVYGGGNLSAFYPDLKETRDTVQAFVIIDGCDQTSIKQVYGGGNAASIPATNITINASYEIEEVFGGGNGLNEIIIHDQTMTNPGANVGYEAYPISYDIPESSKEERTAKFSYGSGKSSVTIYDGLIHRVFGGSNKKGNVRESAVTLLDDQNGCHFQVDEAYGGGKNAPMDAEAKLLMACIPGLKVAYGGAQEADVLGGVTLTITNGTYERVFGGNNISGTIQGPIVVNIEETGCRPIIIGELYGGGNRAAYSVYGYKMVNGELKPRESSSDGDAIAGTPYADPVVNVKSFTSIGTIYGGGYGETAVMVGNPTVNIDVFKGQYADDEDNVINENAKVVGSTVKYSGDGYDTGFPVPSHAKGAIGAIGTVFGGGNAAKVIGTPTVNIGTRVGEQIDLLSVPVEDSNGKTSSEAGWIPTYQKETVLGADIRGDIYGAGNNAEVTGDTKVQIGKKIETSTTPDPDPTPGP